MSAAAFDPGPLLYREITVSINGVPTPTICPIWCELDHDQERHAALSDVSHFSPTVPFGPSANDTTEESAVDADLYWTPNATEGAPTPQLLIWSGGNPIELDLTAAEELLGKLSGLVDQLRMTQGAGR